ncbi:MAG: SMI1/KNR4 family protein [Chloroflexota bacterium]|nr:MAG: SMI1/KNR4 family protein [Chloroflexota bacterium]
MVTIHESRPPITDADIQAVEQQLNIKFPDDYRRFLLAHNGGRPEPEIFLIPDHPIPNQSSILNWFYSIDPSDYYYNILKMVKVFADRMPPEFIPIGCDPGGNQICLVVAGEDKGMIFFWDHEQEMDEGEPPTYDNLFFIADSIDDLLNNRLSEG